VTADPVLPLKISSLGESAILCEAVHPKLDIEIQRRIWALAEALEGSGQVAETVPGMNNILVLFDALTVPRETMETLCQTAWCAAVPTTGRGRTIEIPVSYGGELGEDLAGCAAFAGLDIADYVRIHSEATYTVFALGSQPGFGYLGGLDARLARPRRDTPHPRVMAGSVIIGGAQAGILPQTMASGWHIIGRTDLSLFDPQASPPALLAPGDVVRFVAREVAR
jgi:5-oxoprolinase (ATP-hydrolysing) subunit B